MPGHSDSRKVGFPGRLPDATTNGTPHRHRTPQAVPELPIVTRVDTRTAGTTTRRSA